MAWFLTADNTFVRKPLIFNKKTTKFIMHCNGPFVTHRKQHIFLTAERPIQYAIFRYESSQVASSSGGVRRKLTTSVDFA